MTKKQRVQKILDSNAYMTLATATPDGEPWISPLFFVHDKHNRLYWYSKKDTYHSKLLSKNSRVAVTLFDSQAKEDDVDGLYIKGTARETTTRELMSILPSYARKWLGNTREALKIARGYRDFLGKSPLRMYVVVPQKMWLVGEERIYKGKYLDSRVGVKLGV